MCWENIAFAMICWVCALIFASIALWAFKREDPMHFWSGSTVKVEEITDIRAYNRANGWMWTIYAISMVVTGIVSLFNDKIGVVLLVIICVPGIVVLVMVYKRIYNKYRNRSSIAKRQENYMLNCRNGFQVLMRVICLGQQLTQFGSWVVMFVDQAADLGV